MWGDWGVTSNFASGDIEKAAEREGGPPFLFHFLVKALERENRFGETPTKACETHGSPKLRGPPKLSSGRGKQCNFLSLHRPSPGVLCSQEIRIASLYRSGASSTAGNHPLAAWLVATPSPRA